MTDWTAGYVTDIGYTFGYYPELNPLRTRLALLNAGYACPEFGNACELGFGQGMSVNLHAAASPVAWMGTDFNPSQAAFAQELSVASGSGARLFDESFEEFANRPDLPEFDFIGLHGIWSWISDANRLVIVDFVRRKLKVGGVLYVSYNTLPGWAAFAPMRHLMNQHAQVIGAEGAGIVSRIDGAIDFAEQLLACNPAFGRANPQIADRVKRLKVNNRQYLAHEYFNRDWHPMHFSTMADCLKPAKVQYAGSAHLLDQLDGVNLSAAQRALLGSVGDATFREGVRDFMVNQQFRRDLWIKGARRLPVLEQREAIRRLRVILVVPASAVPTKVVTPLGEAALSSSVTGPLLEFLGDHRAYEIGELERKLAAHGVMFPNLVEILTILAHTGHVLPAQDEHAIQASAAAAHRLNSSLMTRSRTSSDVSYLASPVTGGGVAVGRFGQLFLAAQAAGSEGPEAWARSAWSVLQAQGQRLMKDGRRLDQESDNLAELERQAAEFALEQMPLLKALHLAQEGRTV
jgi:SAM-dependent methyltransferase